MRTSPCKGGNIVTKETFSKDIGKYIHNSSGIKHGIDSAFAVISHHQATELKAGIDEIPSGMAPNPYGFVIIFQVGSIAVRPNIAPLANHRASEIPVVRLVAVTVDHCRRYFTTYLRMGTDGCIAPNFCANIYLRTFTQCKGTPYHGSFIDGSILPQVYRTTVRVQDTGPYRDSFFYKKIFGTVHRRVRVVYPT